VDSLEEICTQIRLQTDKTVRRNLTEGILLSGGLDTSILALVASKYRKMAAFTVAFKNAPAPDVEYAKLIANRLGMNHKLRVFDEEEIFPAIRNVIETLKVFDPMLVRNNVAIYIGLQLAKENGVNSIMTGDALDELFAGYSWLFNLSESELNIRLANMWKVMEFSFIPLAQSLDIVAKVPFLDDEFKAFAMNVDPKLKVKSERGQVYGKWIVRKAFEGLLPDEIIWRVKTPIEIGSGATVFPKFFEASISEDCFNERAKRYLDEDHVQIRDKEQLFYYEVFREFFEAPTKIFSGVKGKLCPQCQSRMDERSNFCRICGAYPI
jgi:asparagine synthase (glutamine-hydrolysing)